MAVEDQTRPRCAGVGAKTWRGRAYFIRVHVRAAWHHPANRGHRSQAVVRVLAFYIRGYLFGLRTCVPVGAHSKMWADTAVPSSVRLVLGNPPDWNAAQAWKHFLGPSRLFVDVGANVGTYSVLAAELGTSVIAVEPDPEARVLLLENAALNGFTLEVLPVALADTTGVMRFTEGMGTMNHLMPGDTIRGVEVDVQTLDDVLGDRTADGIKIDVEGAERLVLDGASRALAEKRLPVIQMEWNGMSKVTLGEDREELAGLLRRNGYQLCRADDQGRLHPLDETGVSAEDVFAVLDHF